MALNPQKTLASVMRFGRTNIIFRKSTRRI
jgi:hypothetical protein